MMSPNIKRRRLIAAGAFGGGLLALPTSRLLWPTVGQSSLTNPDGLRRWREAYSLGNHRPAKIWCVGDSIWWGVGTAGFPGGDVSLDGEELADRLGWPGQLRTLLARKFSTSPAGTLLTKNFIPQGAKGADSRVVYTGVAKARGDLGLMGLRSLASVDAELDGSWTFAVPQATNIELLYWDEAQDAATPPPFSVTIDGEPWRLSTPSSLAQGYWLVSLKDLPPIPHEVIVTVASGSVVNIPFITYSSNKGVIVGRFGKPGWTLQDMAGYGTFSGMQSFEGRSRLEAGLTAGKPDLVILGFGHNDCNKQFEPGQRTTPQAHQELLQRTVEAITEEGAAVLLLSSPWPQSQKAPPGGASYDAYWDVREYVAAQYEHCAHARIADWWGTPAGSSHLQIANSVHPNAEGYKSIAKILFSLLNEGISIDTA